MEKNVNYLKKTNDKNMPTMSIINSTAYWGAVSVLNMITGFGVSWLDYLGYFTKMKTSIT